MESFWWYLSILVNPIGDGSMLAMYIIALVSAVALLMLLSQYVMDLVNKNYLSQ